MTRPANGMRWVQIVVPVLAVSLMALGGWVLNAERRLAAVESADIESLENRVAAIEHRITIVEATRFTSSDGLRVFERLTEIEANKANKNEVPPARFEQRVDGIEARVFQLERFHRDEPEASR